MNQGLAYKQTWGKYNELRSVALEIAHQQLPEILTNKFGVSTLKSQVSLNNIDLQAAQTLKNWEYAENRLAEWDWDKQLKKYRTHPKRFELAIWHRKHFLTGASIGRPTWSGNRLRIDLIEASPRGGPLEGVITDIVILSATIYGRIIGASQLRIMKPVNERVRAFYLSKPGFAYDAKGNFCYKDI